MVICRVSWTLWQRVQKRLRQPAEALSWALCHPRKAASLSCWALRRKRVGTAWVAGKALLVCVPYSSSFPPTAWPVSSTTTPAHAHTTAPHACLSLIFKALHDAAPALTHSPWGPQVSPFPEPPIAYFFTELTGTLAGDRPQPSMDPRSLQEKPTRPQRQPHENRRLFPLDLRPPMYLRLSSTF